VWLRLLFKVFFHAEMHQNNVFFIFKKLFLRSAHQNDPKHTKNWFFWKRRLARISKRSLKKIEEGITLFDPVKKSESTRVKKPDDFFGQNEVVMIKKQIGSTRVDPPDLWLWPCSGVIFKLGFKNMIIIIFIHIYYPDLWI
jgi:hypothetical protein